MIRETDLGHFQLIRCGASKESERLISGSCDGCWKESRGQLRLSKPLLQFGGAQARPILQAACQRRLPLSWKVRYRTLLWFFIQMIKLYEAPSLLYRRQILQENIRWKALDEIYKIYMLLHRSDVSISANVRETFSHFSAIFANI